LPQRCQVCLPKGSWQHWELFYSRVCRLLGLGVGVEPEEAQPEPEPEPEGELLCPWPNQASLSVHLVGLSAALSAAVVLSSKQLPAAELAVAGSVWTV
jgi:hypothetical protein